MTKSHLQIVQKISTKDGPLFIRLTWYCTDFRLTMMFCGWYLPRFHFYLDSLPPQPLLLLRAFLLPSAPNRYLCFVPPWNQGAAYSSPLAVYRVSSMSYYWDALPFGRRVVSFHFWWSALRHLYLSASSISGNCYSPLATGRNPDSRRRWNTDGIVHANSCILCAHLCSSSMAVAKNQNIDLQSNGKVIDIECLTIHSNFSKNSAFFASTSAVSDSFGGAAVSHWLGESVIFASKSCVTSACNCTSKRYHRKRQHNLTSFSLNSVRKLRFVLTFPTSSKWKQSVYGFEKISAIKKRLHNFGKILMKREFQKWIKAYERLDGTQFLLSSQIHFEWFIIMAATVSNENCKIATAMSLIYSTHFECNE